MKNTLRSLVTTLLLSFLFHQNIAGQIQTGAIPDFQCASDAMMVVHPLLMEKQLELENQLLKTTEGEKAFTPPYTLPVVVHIVHNNGAENLSDDQVFDAIEWLNDAFGHQGYYANKGPGFNTQVQFCLAKRDPDGNATTGITRTVSLLTNMNKETDDLPLKNLNRWQTTDYVNIWVVNDISSQSSGSAVAGYAYLASAHGEPFDGIVCEAGYFGSSEPNNVILIHEMGHYLNLYHTFYKGCKNDDCLTDGDRVCDTPPDQATFCACNFNSCHTDTDDTSANNPFTMDVNDFADNYMDFSSFNCYHAFTEGQANRMYEAIEFLRQSLLESKGCLDPCPEAILVDFEASATEVLAGDSIYFTNLSTGNGSYEWRIDGAVFSNNANPFYQFNDLGEFEIELIATDADSLCLDRKRLTIQVNCPLFASFEVDATELEIGEVFTAVNTSQGAEGYEWWINGVLVSNEVDLNYFFHNASIYTILLKAVGNVCFDSFSKVVVVKPGECDLSPPISGYFEFTDSEGLVSSTIAGFAPNGDVFFRAFPASNERLVGRLNSNGEILWQLKYQLDQDGDREYTGTHDGGLFIHNGVDDEKDQFLIKIDSTGQVAWVKNTEIADDDFVKAVPFKTGIALFGTESLANKFYSIGLDYQGDIKWNKVYNLSEGFSIHETKITTDGQGFWIVGNGGEYPNFGGTILKSDTLGNLLFSKKYLEVDSSRVGFRTFDITLDDGIIATGDLSGQAISGLDVLVAKFDKFGIPTWGKTFGTISSDPYRETGIRMFSEPDGSGYLTYVWDLEPNGDNKWLSINFDGTLAFARSYSSAQEDLRHFRMHRNGDYLLAEWTSTNKELLYVEYEPETGPKMDCVESTEYDMGSLDASLYSSEISFSLSSETIPLFADVLVEFPIVEEMDALTICSYTPICPEICNNSLDDDEDGYIDCFDSDCDCFQEVDCKLITGIDLPIKGKVAWRTPNDEVCHTTLPIVANLNPQTDSIPEIIVSEGLVTNNTAYTFLIYKGDGSNVDNPEKIHIDEGFQYENPSPAIGDLNNDGIPEMVVFCRDHLIRVYTNYTPGEPSAMTLLATADVTLGRASPHISLADFNSDGTPEILVDSDVYQLDFSNPNAPTLARVLKGIGHDGAFNYLAFSQTSAVDLISPTDCLGDPDCEGLEILAGGNIYSVDLDPFDGDGLEIKTLRDINNMVVGPFHNDGYSYAADVDLDGVMDVVTRARIGGKMGVYVWNKDGLLMSHLDVSSANDMHSTAIANVYDDRLDGY